MPRSELKAYWVTWRHTSRLGGCFVFKDNYPSCMLDKRDGVTRFVYPQWCICSSSVCQFHRSGSNSTSIKYKPCYSSLFRYANFVTIHVVSNVQVYDFRLVMDELPSHCLPFCVITAKFNRFGTSFFESIDLFNFVHSSTSYDALWIGF